MSESKPYGIDQKPLYGCCQCNDEYSWPADDLRVYEGQCWCASCWDYHYDDNNVGWSSLQKFEPMSTTAAGPWRTDEPPKDLWNIPLILNWDFFVPVSIGYYYAGAWYNNILNIIDHPTRWAELNLAP